MPRRRTTAGLGVAVLATVGTALGAGNLDDAVLLYREHHYAQARSALEPLAAAQPSNAEAAYYLGMAIKRAGGQGSLDGAHLWLGKAVKLAPANLGYLADYGGVCLLLADRDSSLTLAVEGRDAMIRAVAGNPADLEACEGLMRFYARAPWPLGDARKAMDLAANIARRNPARAPAAYASLVAGLEAAGRREDADLARQAGGLAPAAK
ncbi:MAG TPA: hypothetical protein VGG34_03325 [Opitutaceae bacterium]